MTQKELLYVEDAINHERNIIAYCEDTLEYLEEEQLVSFMEKEIKKHESIEQKLLKLLEEKTNE